MRRAAGPDRLASDLEPATNTDAVTVIEHANFAVSDAAGDISPGSYHGLFVADTRYLSRFSLRLSGKRLERLSAGAEEQGAATFYLTNPGIGRVRPSTIAVIRDRSVSTVMRERIRLVSYNTTPLRLRLTLEVGVDFADIFEVRGHHRLVRRVDLRHTDHELTFRYRHRGYHRTTVVSADRAFSTDDGTLSFEVPLERGVPWDLNLTVTPRQEHSGDVPALPAARVIDPERVRRWAERVPQLISEDRRLERAWTQAIADMSLLLLSVRGGGFIPAAGLPWYMAVFGRDAAIATMQTLLMGHDLAYGTLSQLADYQGLADDRFREEEPGKIPHEVRSGELAVLDHVPHARYYGSVDATPLFVLLFIEACRWSGWLETDALGPSADAPAARAHGGLPPDVARNLPAAEAALAWIEAHTDPDGLIRYQRLHPRAIRNQVWKDSDDSYRFADGRIADPPIAAIEVQGYAVAAHRGMADVFDGLGRHSEARRQRTRADELAAAIERFWMPEAGAYAMGLDRQGQLIDSITSNPGHLLWNGVLTPQRAEQVVERLLAPDMFSGWGIRTMSNRMAAYNPISYHNGSVWPHDNSLIAAGMARYGHDRAAWKVIDAQLDAADADRTSRLPELFAGFDRRTTRDLVNYAVACSPQAWATGAIVLAVQTLLRAQPGRAEPQVSPLAGAPRLELRNARIGGWSGVLRS